MENNISKLAFYNTTRGKILSGIECTFYFMICIFAYSYLFLWAIKMDRPDTFLPQTISELALIMTIGAMPIFGLFGFLLGYFKQASFLVVKLFPLREKEIIKFKENLKIRLSLKDQKDRHEENVKKFLKMKIP